MSESLTPDPHNPIPSPLDLVGLLSRNVDPAETEVVKIRSDLELADRLGQETEGHLEVGLSRLTSIVERSGHTALLGVETTTTESGLSVVSNGLVIPPRLSEMKADNTRNNLFSFVKGTSPDKKFIDKPGSETEQIGLISLDLFLQRYIEWRSNKGSAATDEDHVLSNYAESIRKNLNFLGKKEMDEAITALGVKWKNYLEEDPRNQICVLAEVASLKRYQNKFKSDVLIRDSVLASFTDDELSEYSGRIVGKLDDISANPDNTKVVLVDDWTISGGQIRSVFNMMCKDGRFVRYVSAGRVEIDLLTARKELLENGFEMTVFNDARVPVDAHFQSFDASHFGEQFRAHYGSLTSATNYGYRDEIYYMASRLGKAVPRLIRPLRFDRTRSVRDLDIGINKRNLKRRQRRA